MLYTVVRCKGCGTIQVSSCNDFMNSSFKCRKCKKSTRYISKRGHYKLINRFKDFSNPTEASLFCMDLKKAIAENKPNFKEDFNAN